MNDVVQRARELLAAEYQREGIKGVEPEIFDADRAALRAIAAALREQPEARANPFQDAFFEIAFALNIGAKPYPPKEALERDILPRIRELMGKQPEARGVVDVIELGRLLVREREAIGGEFTPDWQLFRDALTAAQQPEARGVVDDVTRDAARWRKLIANTKTDHIWHFVLSEEHKEGHDHFLDVIDALPLTAAQQPVQEGGGEPVEQDECPACENNRRFCANCDSTGFVPATAPPSAPVGVREAFAAIRRAAARTPHRDDTLALYAAHATFSQQPAQAAPGWKLVTVEPIDAMREAFNHWRPAEGAKYAGAQSVNAQEQWEFGQRYAAMLAATPPGDDAAGGGS